MRPATGDVKMYGAIYSRMMCAHARNREISNVAPRRSSAQSPNLPPCLCTCDVPPCSPSVIITDARCRYLSRQVRDFNQQRINRDSKLLVMSFGSGFGASTSTPAPTFAFGNTPASTATPVKPGETTFFFFWCCDHEFPARFDFLDYLSRRCSARVRVYIIIGISVMIYMHHSCV